MLLHSRLNVRAKEKIYLAIAAAATKKGVEELKLGMVLRRRRPRACGAKACVLRFCAAAGKRQPARWSLGATREKRAALFSVAQAGGCRGGKGVRARESCASGGSAV